MVVGVAIILAGSLLGAPQEAVATSCSRGVVALTFDDGPGRHTPAVLDALARRDVPATFFVIGQLARGRPSLIRRQDREGHAVGNHTYRHERLTSLSDARIRSTVWATSAAIRDAGVRPINAVRPPYGATSSRVRRVLRDVGYAHVLWTVDTRDWEGPSSSTIARRAINGLAPGANILFHDGSSRAPNTIAALPQIIDTARARGYCFGTLDDRGRIVAPAPAPPPPPPPPPQQVAPPQEITEIAGPDRYATAVAASQSGWPDGAEQAVLATGENYPDALTASVLAGKVGGPLLLVPEDGINPTVAQELARLGTQHAYLVGPLSDAVEQGARDLGVDTTRLRGADRYETAMLIATEVSQLEAEAVFVASGESFADALAAGALAAGLGHPILLTPPSGDGRVATWVEELGARRAWVVGGEAAVAESAIAHLPEVERIAGPNRAATAAALADFAVAQGYGRDPFIASGHSFPDGLAGGVLAARLERPVLLTGRDRLSTETHAWLGRHGASRVTVLGGMAAIGPGPRCQLETGYDRPDACS